MGRERSGVSPLCRRGGSGLRSSLTLHSVLRKRFPEIFSMWGFLPFLPPFPEGFPVRCSFLPSFLPSTTPLPVFEVKPSLETWGTEEGREGIISGNFLNVGFSTRRAFVAVSCRDIPQIAQQPQRGISRLSCGVRVPSLFLGSQIEAQASHQTPHAPTTPNQTEHQTTT